MPELKEGMAAPDFELPDAFGKKTKLSDFRGKKVVLYFYPEDDTPGCTIQGCEFTGFLDDFIQKGAVILGVSVDNEQSHQKFIQKYNLKIRLLSDTGKKVVQHYGVWKEKNVYGKKSMGTSRTTFLIDENQKIKKIWHVTEARGHAKEVLEQLAL